MQRITFLIGPSGSGKSTETLKYVSEHKGVFVINRDALRRAVIGKEHLRDYYVGNITPYENAVTEMANSIIRVSAKTRNSHLWVDNTNLRMDYIDSIVREWMEKRNRLHGLWRRILRKKVNLYIEFRVMPNVSLDDLIHRVALRDSLPHEKLQYIKKMYWTFQTMVNNLPDVIEEYKHLWNGAYGGAFRVVIKLNKLQL